MGEGNPFPTSSPKQNELTRNQARVHRANEDKHNAVTLCTKMTPICEQSEKRAKGGVAIAGLFAGKKSQAGQRGEQGNTGGKRKS